ncbi:MAG: hypothetical protein U9O98_10430, partial [Asgard group archaeon]|nr:hypothetical protein [Asgard group archaeon]
HCYALLLQPIYKNVLKSSEKHDAFKSKKRFNPVPLLKNQKEGSLFLSRYFFSHPKSNNDDKISKKTPMNKYYPPKFLLIAHYSNTYAYPKNKPREKLDTILTSSIEKFDNYVQTEIHPTLHSLGKPFYLKGKDYLINYHLIREIPKRIILELFDKELLPTITKTKTYNYLFPSAYPSRTGQETVDQLLSKQINPNALGHIITAKDRLIPITEKNFPLVIVGEQNTRRNLILNLLKNVNGRFLILDPQEQYGKLTEADSKVKGYVLGENLILNISGTEGKAISKQIYAHWFAKIIGYFAQMYSSSIKTLETYLLGVYNDPQNQEGTEIRFRSFANQEVTSEIARMNRTDATLLTNVLYPLSTYDSLSIVTRIGRKNSFEQLFSTKGAIIQFSRNDKQHSQIAYLFTILKLRSLTLTEPVFVILENFDNYYDEERNRSGMVADLTNLVLELPSNFRVILGIRSPSKIKSLFKNAKMKFINRLLNRKDQALLEKEYNFQDSDNFTLNTLSEEEYFLITPSLFAPTSLKIMKEPDTSLRISVNELEKKSLNRILHSEDYLQKDGIPLQIKKAIFSMIKVLKEKPRKILPEEGFEKLIKDSSPTDILRAKEIAREERFFKFLQHSPKDSNETINLIQLTERGEAFYQSYLDLQQQLPMVSICSLQKEKDFEQLIFSNLESAQNYLKKEQFEETLDLMINITIKMLAVLPEKDRFIKDTHTAKIFEFWSYLTTIKEYESTPQVKILFPEFFQNITNALKELKHSVLEKQTNDKANSANNNAAVKTIRSSDNIRKPFTKNQDENWGDSIFNFSSEDLQSPSDTSNDIILN